MANDELEQLKLLAEGLNSHWDTRIYPSDETVCCAKKALESLKEGGWSLVKTEQAYAIETVTMYEVWEGDYLYSVTSDKVGAQKESDKLRELQKAYPSRMKIEKRVRLLAVEYQRKPGQRRGTVGPKTGPGTTSTTCPSFLEHKTGIACCELPRGHETKGHSSRHQNLTLDLIW